MKIVVGVDGSETAQRAVDYVSWLVAEQLGPGDHVLILVSVIRPPSGSGFQFSRHVDADIYRVFREKAERVLEETADRLAQLDAGLQLVHDTGDPAQVLARIAVEEEADLVVVGSRGVGGIRGLALGSVSQRAVLVAPCPVLVVRGKKEEQELRQAALEPTAEEAAVGGQAPPRGQAGRIERRPRCSRCGALLAAENTSQDTGYCDPCRSLVEGEIRRRSGFGTADD